MTRNPTIGKQILRALVLALIMTLCVVAPALAEDAANWAAVRNLVNNRQNVEIKLTGDMRLNWNNGTLEIDNGKNVTIDLNGHSIQGENGFGDVYLRVKNGTLTIKDSATVTTSSASDNRLPRHDQNDTTVTNGTGIALPATFSNGTLTYYVTSSNVKDKIFTQESLTKHTADLSKAGRLLGTSNHWAGLVVAEGSNATLRIEGGLFTNPNNQAVRVINGATAQIVGGYFVNNAVPYGAGAAVQVQNATLTVGGDANHTAVFASNTAYSGGAMSVESGANVTIKDGAIFSGNKATGSDKDGGGAISVGRDGHLTMEGGLVTHNWCTDNVTGNDASCSSYDVCGGGILVQGTMEMKGGQVTSNEAPGGGGISTKFWDGGVFTMTGGIVAGNYARLNEGGGIVINMNGRGSITGGHITNNVSEGLNHWGGGGIFSSNDSVLTMLNTLITDNTAGGYGGGLAGCSTARVDTHAVQLQKHSTAIYGNHAQGTFLSGDASTKPEDWLYAQSDPTFIRDGGAHYQDYFSALNATVCGGFLGQGTANWSGTVDGMAVDQGSIEQNETVYSQSILGLTSHVNKAHINNAINIARVFVTGNKAGTHGGGILCNGYMIIGTHRHMDVGDRMVLQGDKTLANSRPEAGQFTFAVADMDGNVLFTGTNNNDGEIIFNGRLSFSQSGTYVYKVYEEEIDRSIPSNKRVIKDSTEYIITVVVESSTSTVQAVDDADPSKTEPIDVTFHRIKSVTVEGPNSSVTLDNQSTDDRSSFVLEGRYLAFHNHVSEHPVLETGIDLSKTVHYGSADVTDQFTFTITLQDKDGKPVSGTFNGVTFNSNGVATVTLKDGQDKEITGIPAGTRYTIVEAPHNGYYTKEDTLTDTVPSEGMAEVLFENYAVGSLKISKALVSPFSADTIKPFTFTLTLEPGAGVTSVVDAIVTKGNTSTNERISLVNGVATFELEGGETITLHNLPADLKYTVSEASYTGFDTSSTNATGFIELRETQTVSYTNTRQTGDLHVHKHVVSVDENDKNTPFDFTVQITELLNTPSYQLGQLTIGNTTRNAVFTYGLLSFELKDGEIAKLTGLPVGVHYLVSEPHDESGDGHDHNHGFAVTTGGTETGVVTQGTSVAEFVNTAFSGLVISKVTSGSEAERNTAYPFLITLKDENNNPINGTFNGVTFTNGQATVYIKDGQSQIIDGLVLGTQITVTEQLTSNHFHVLVNGTESTNNPTFTHQITQEGASVHAHFVNEHKRGNLTISKRTVSPIASDAMQPFTFTIELDVPLNGTYGSVTFVNGKATVYLKDGQSVTATNIPVGINYTVTEAPMEGFVSTYSGNDNGTISVNDSSVAYTNTRTVGDLSITKDVYDRTEADSTVFSFEIVLNPAYNGTFGGVEFVNGKAYFTLLDGATKTFTDLPMGTMYTITEVGYDATKYAPVYGTVTGDVGPEPTESVHYVNKALNSLTITKTVANEIPGTTAEFSFTVTLKDSANQPLSGTFGGVTFDANGQATFTLADGQEKVITSLPAGTTYTVTEAANDNYITTMTGNTGKISTAASSVAAFTNTRKTGGLEVSKTVANEIPGTTAEFAFTVTLSDNSISGIFGDMTFVDGVATFTLGHNQKKTATGLPTGTAYSVVETANDNYTVTKTGETGTIVANETQTAAFVNTRNVEVFYGDLTVSKTVEGNDANLTDRFDFTVTLGDKSISGTFGDMTFVNGVATFELGHGESLTATDLPAGTTYTVEETDAKGYTVTKSGETGTIVANETQTAAFVNTRNVEVFYGDLMVSKTISGNDANLTDRFDFTVTLGDKSISGTFGDMTFVNGVATFELGHGESLTATDLPAGTTYTVEETDAKGYTVNSKGAVGFIQPNCIMTASFVNTREVITEYGTLMINKIVSGNAGDVTRKFTFQVVLESPINGTYGDMTFVNGTATFQLAHGESAVAQRLPAGIGYTVQELDFDDYIVIATNDTGVVPANAIRLVTFENQRVDIDVPETGDHSDIWMYATLLIVSAGLLVLRDRKIRKA